jgi:CheY-like chemotaxis protein
MKKKLFCLLIDDDPDDRNIFAMAVERLPVKVKLDYAVHGIEGVQKLKGYGDKLPDFIFLDLNMHLMNGKECLGHIKRIAKVSEVPVIIYSTTLNESIIYETLAMGAFDHIEKPTELSTLEKYLKRIFQIEEMV